MFVAKSIRDLVSSCCISRDLIQGLYPQVLPKINESKNQKVLWNAEQMQVVGYIEKKIMFQGRLNKKNNKVKAQYCSAEQINILFEVSRYYWCVQNQQYFSNQFMINFDFIMVNFFKARTHIT